MFYHCRAATLAGEVPIPGSKSHTIRAVMIAALAEGESRIEAPLVSADALSAAQAATALGATVAQAPGLWRVTGCGGRPRFRQPVIDTGNSGTTMNVLLGMAALAREGEVVLTGDAQVQRRPNGPLADALNRLGATVVSLRGNGCPPFRVRGPLRGGFTTLEAPTSQYLTSLLLACPLAEGDSEIEVRSLKEESYAEMTLAWLAAQGLRLERDGLRRFRIPGGQRYRAFNRRIPADFSSASFFLCAGALGRNRVTSYSLDLADTQGDKAVIDYLRAMGAGVTVAGDRVTVEGRGLRGTELDLNLTPDALPILAVTACFADGTTVLGNVAHARIKETDRIAVMACELRKLGARIEERPDGLVIQGGAPLRGAAVCGHGDHRVVMSLAIAGQCIPGETVIDTAEAAGVTFPEFPQLLQGLGGQIDCHAD